MGATRTLMSIVIALGSIAAVAAPASAENDHRTRNVKEFYKKLDDGSSKRASPNPPGATKGPSLSRRGASTSWWLGPNWQSTIDSPLRRKKPELTPEEQIKRFKEAAKKAGD